MIVDKNKILQAKEKLGIEIATIIAEDLKIDQFNERDLKGCCPFHNEDSPSFIFSTKDFAYKCFGCGKRLGILDHWMSFYNISYLEALQKLSEKTNINFNLGEKGIKTERNYRYPVREYNENRSKVESYAALRKISKETLDYADVQEDNHGNMVFHFYDSNDVLSLVKYRPARKVQKSETKTWCQKDTDTKSVLFNMNRIDPTQPLIINEGELDSLSVIECGMKNCVSVPFGAGNFLYIEQNWEWFEQFESIICWSDSDEPGIKMRKEICSRLGAWKCKFVDIPEELNIVDGKKLECKDANSVLCFHGKEKVIELIENAQEIPVSGVVDLSSADDFDLELSPGLYTHLKPIDDIVYKFLFGSVVLVTGTKGSGKSTLLNQIFVCESLEQNHDVFIYSGELSTPVLKSWVELSMAGREKTRMKENKFVHLIDPTARKQMQEWYKNRIWVYDELSNKADEVLEKAITVTRKFGVKTWIIDNLMVLDLGNGPDIYERQKEFMNKLIRLAKLYGVLIVLVAHPRKIQSGFELGADDISGSNSLGNLAQYIISIKRYTEKEKRGEKDGRGNYKSGKFPIEHDVAVEIFKNRFSGKVGRENLYFDYTSYRFYSTPAELYKRFSWNKDTSPLPKEDPNNHEQMPESMRG